MKWRRNYFSCKTRICSWRFVLCRDENSSSWLLNSTLWTERRREGRPRTDRSNHPTQSQIYILSLTSARTLNKPSPAPQTTEPNTTRAEQPQSSWFHFHPSVWIPPANQTRSHLTETLPDASCTGFLSVQTNRQQFVMILPSYPVMTAVFPGVLVPSDSEHALTKRPD